MIDVPGDVLGLVFDCDGTIADTMPLHYQAWVAAMDEYGSAISEEMFYELAGMPTADVVRLLNKRHGYQLPVDEAANRKEELYVKLIPQVVGIEPVVKLVHHFSGRLPMAVATGATLDICRTTLGSLGLIKHFDAIVTADDVTHGKPAPDIFLEAARRINVAPEACCAFEDGELGLRAARAAGMITIDIRPAHRESLRFTLAGKKS